MLAAKSKSIYLIKLTLWHLTNNLENNVCLKYFGKTSMHCNIKQALLRYKVFTNNNGLKFLVLDMLRCKLNMK